MEKRGSLRLSSALRKGIHLFVKVPFDAICMTM
jgi:hypothetical protein